MTWTAYVDECEAVYRGHTYSLAASLIDTTAAEEIADALRAITVPRSRKLHWYDEHKTERRTLLARTVAELAGVEHLVVVLAAAPSGTRPERRRRQCLTRLLPELCDLGVTQVIAEAREAKQNARDVQLLLGLRNQKIISGPFRLDHVPGPSTPLLAVADIAVGAVMSAYAGDPTYRDILDGKITELVI
ncbi:hypothetical protein CLV30_101135 [Haloactinopolyspora alba]|uniref:DUF3800 domain-containing protein n=1 Tax=Haloactinopolyspora alba TaxID=648780 RepID=A0A2P8EFC5_9ACTN|nr:hypothetical protein [Haloactinopolyspora alba]PSL08168.1 hypothetical protein CLV30_101135 [Haloactinopolyspora alba]